MSVTKEIIEIKDGPEREIQKEELFIRTLQTYLRNEMCKASLILSCSKDCSF